MTPDRPVQWLRDAWRNTIQRLHNFASGLWTYLRWKYRRYRERIFDEEYGLETANREPDSFHSVDSKNVKFAIPYEAIQMDVFSRMMIELAKSISIPGEYSFIDLGSGKGRALFYAAEMNFRKCIGVEFSPLLHEVALRNVESYISRNATGVQFELHCTDVADFDLPNCDIVLFLYNPFVGHVMQSLLKKLQQFVEGTTSDLIILYRNPTCAEYFDLAFLTTLASTQSYRIYRRAPGGRS